MHKKLLSDERGSWLAWGCGGILLILALATLAFIWYINNGLPRTHPTHHTNLLWGFLHGIFIVPDLVLSLLFNKTVAIYQTPNDGNLYNIGFVVGVCAAFSGASNAGAVAVGSRYLRN